MYLKHNFFFPFFFPLSQFKKKKQNKNMIMTI